MGRSSIEDGAIRFWLRNIRGRLCKGCIGIRTEVRGRYHHGEHVLHDLAVVFKCINPDEAQAQKSEEASGVRISFALVHVHSVAVNSALIAQDPLAIIYQRTLSFEFRGGAMSSSPADLLYVILPQRNYDTITYNSIRKMWPVATTYQYHYTRSYFQASMTGGFPMSADPQMALSAELF